MGVGAGHCQPPQGYFQVQGVVRMGFCWVKGLIDAFEVKNNPNLKKSKGTRSTDLVRAAGKGAVGGLEEV